MSRGLCVARLSLLSLVGLIVLPVGTQGQLTIRNIKARVLDGRDRPIPFVSVLSNGRSITTSDDSGRFLVRVAHQDRVVLDLRRVGYVPTRVTLLAGGDTDIAVLMLPAIRELPSVAVEETPIKSPALEGFERRMRERQRGAGSGTFITAKDVSDMSATRSSQVVERVPSIAVRRVGTAGDRYAIFGRLTTGEECAATVFIDGIRIGGSGDRMTGRDRRGRPIIVRDGQPVLVDDFIIPADIAGVEVYPRGLFAPPRYSPTDPDAAKCAIVLYWTRHAT